MKQTCILASTKRQAESLSRLNPGSIVVEEGEYWIVYIQKKEIGA